MSQLQQEITRRQTFAIIAHPDAGKTTLTEKLLLFGGAIHTAGAVKSNKIKKSTVSDFMEIEKQRGISVATSVMAFEYKGKKINILDTPGHKDFAEDTYRTLTAVDSVIMVLDGANGVESQTEKLMEVCRMRDTPVLTFINKFDRESKDPFDLLDEIEQKLGIQVHPLTFPINMGDRFKGVYNLYKKSLNLFSPSKTEVSEGLVQIHNLQDAILESYIGEEDAAQLRKDVELIESVYGNFDLSAYLAGKVTPVFFGSAVYNFGVQELLDNFIAFAPNPKPRQSNLREVKPEEEKFTGFIFKIHANLDPNHRDRIAFCRVVSGTFERNTFYHHVRLAKKFKFANPTSFMAQEKSVIEQAYAGDVVGLYDSGNFKIGDTLTEGENILFTGIPNFSPEIFRELVNKDPMKTKQLEKGIGQLSQEGVAQVFTQILGNRKIVGTVGELQFEVIQYRLAQEYGAKVEFVAKNFYKAFWVTCDEQAIFDDFMRRKANSLAKDKDENWVFLAESQWMLQMAKQDFPDVVFHEHSDFKLVHV
jgi:peptide chain release factor 3